VVSLVPVLLPLPAVLALDSRSSAHGAQALVQQAVVGFGPGVDVVDGFAQLVQLLSQSRGAVGVGWSTGVGVLAGGVVRIELAEHGAVLGEGEGFEELGDASVDLVWGGKGDGLWYGGEGADGGEGVDGEAVLLLGGGSEDVLESVGRGVWGVDLGGAAVGDFELLGQVVGLNLAGRRVHIGVWSWWTVDDGCFNDGVCKDTVASRDLSSVQTVTVPRGGSLVSGLDRSVDRNF
jgi:hypothetical protein